MPARVPGTIRIFDRHDFYSTHGDDALYVADTVFKTHSVLKFLGRRTNDSGLASCTLTPSACKAFLRDALTSKQLRVEVWKPAEGVRRGTNWELARQASPGNLQEVEDLLFLDTDMAVSYTHLTLPTKRIV